ncbi:MAG: 2'-5' RNA ligase family protein [Nakamurella sp.]
MPRLVVVLPLVPLQVGDGFSLKDWPLHLTVAPTFVIGAELPAVVAAIAASLDQQRSVVVAVGKDEGFGHSGKIPVTLIEPAADLTGMHHRLVDALLQVGAVFDDPQFVGLGYRPHVTITRLARVSMGDSLTLRQAALVDMAPAGDHRLRRVVWARSLR